MRDHGRRLGGRAMPFTLPELPYAKSALAPYMSEETLEYHHDKHHATYVTNLNTLTAADNVADDKLEDVILTSDGPIFNNAAQVWNHAFFWRCLKPGGGGAPAGDLAAAIDRDFGGFDKFKEQFMEAATGQFGSGWAWLVENAGALKVVKTANADLPLKHGMKALLTDRCVGTRLLHRLSQCPRQVRDGGPRPSRGLGLRCFQIRSFKVRSSKCVAAPHSGSGAGFGRIRRGPKSARWLPGAVKVGR